MTDPIPSAALAHLDLLTMQGTATGYGPRDMPFWMAALDPRTRRHPEGERDPRLPSRCYRAIASPWGANLYWDLPQIVAAHAWAVAGDRPALAVAADAYVSAWFAGCVDGDGLPWWGNHYFWDARRGVSVGFIGNEDPVPVAAGERAHHHEVRPLPVPWAAVARVAPDAARRAVLAMGAGHVVSTDGCFDRHAIGTPQRGNHHAFLESGATLAASLAWLGAQPGGEESARLAATVLRWSAAQRGPSGLLRNSPTKDRWDMHVCTSEVGFWAGGCLRASELLGDAGLVALAADGLRAWLAAAWDGQAGMFRGRVRVADGGHDDTPRTTPYQPGRWCDCWNPVFPDHDHPFACAEACLALWRATGDEAFALGARRWALHLDRQGDPRSGTDRGFAGTYAEHYGRAIHFLAEAGTMLADSRLTRRAEALADEALARLGTGGLLRSHPGEERYEAVDGVGVLLLGLHRLRFGRDPDLMGWWW